MTNSEPLIRGMGVCKSYALGKAGLAINVLKGIDFSIRKGEIVSIVGPSGSGKSTLLHILGGLDRPTAGDVFWKETNLSMLTDRQLSQRRISHVGFVFQFHHLLQEFTALENVMIPCMIAGASVQAARQRASELLSRLGLADRGDHKPSELSGGEQQRAAIARGLANDPSILLADEPSGNLDSENSRLLYDLLWEMNKSRGQTILIVTHNDLFAANSDRVFRMEDGNLKNVRTPE